MEYIGDVFYEYGGGLYANITNKCPDRCEFCIRYMVDSLGGADSLWLKREPTMEEILELLDQWDLSKFEELVFCGYGEPMLKLAILKEVCQYLKDNYPKIKIRVNTNGHANYVFGKNVVPELKGLVDLFSVSLNGVDEKEYNELSQPKFDGAYEEVKKFIKACSDCGIKVVASVVEGYKGRHIDLENCEKTAKELGADFRAREWIPAGYS